MIGIVRTLWWILASLLKSRKRLEAENLALRHQGGCAAPTGGLLKVAIDVGDSSLTDLDPKLEKFAVDARCAPQQILPRYAPDQ